MEISKLKKLKKMAENGGSFDFERYHIVCDSYNAKLDSGKITVISGTYLYSNETVGEIYREICTCSYKNMEVLAVITPDGKMVVNKYSFTPDEKTDDIISFTEYSKRYRGKVMETVYEDMTKLRHPNQFHMISLKIRITTKEGPLKYVTKTEELIALI